MNKSLYLSIYHLSFLYLVFWLYCERPYHKMQNNFLKLIKSCNNTYLRSVHKFLKFTFIYILIFIHSFNNYFLWYYYLCSIILGSVVSRKNFHVSSLKHTLFLSLNWPLQFFYVPNNTPGNKAVKLFSR